MQCDNNLGPNGIPLENLPFRERFPGSLTGLFSGEVIGSAKTDPVRFKWRGTFERQICLFRGL